MVGELVALRPIAIGQAQGPVIRNRQPTTALRPIAI